LQHMDPQASRAEILSETGHVVAVRDVSVQIGEGEIFVVMGLSGSGKSTLIRCLSRLIEPTAGQVTCNQADVTQMNDDELRQFRRHTVSMVFQRFGLFPHRRVIDNVGYGLEVQGVESKKRQKIAQDTLELVGLDGWQHHYPHELSGGMQQRVGLARALAVDPEIMLCDEPFSALDPLIRRDMQNELLHLQTSLHKTIIFITHDFLEALKLGDRIAIMKDGAIVQVGTPQQIVANPANEYVREFTQDVPRAKVLTATEVMSPPDASIEMAGEVSHSTTLEALIPLVLDLDDKQLAVMSDSQEIIGTLGRKDVLLALAEG
ncbi:MAG: betaine/proline/choline family ABC transporter ATP-binding protein, partial [Chloroflexota bacterium]